MAISREQLQAEREQVKAEVAQHRRIIARHRAGIARADKQYADSFDRLAESQKLVRQEMPSGTVTRLRPREC